MSERIGWADFTIALKWADVPSELKKILPKATAYFKRPVVPSELLYFMFNLKTLVKPPKNKEERMEYDLIVAALKDKKPDKQTWDTFLQKMSRQKSEFVVITGRDLYTMYLDKRAGLSQHGLVFNENQFYNIIQGVTSISETSKNLGCGTQSIATNTNFVCSKEDLNKADEAILAERFLYWILKKHLAEKSKKKIEMPYYAELAML